MSTEPSTESSVGHDLATSTAAAQLVPSSAGDQAFS